MDVSVLDPRKLDPRKLDPRMLDPRKLRPMTYGAEMREIAMVAIDSFRQNRVRFALTALGLVIAAGRFFDADDARNKVAVITDKLAQKTYGGQDAAVGQSIRISGLPFTIIGTFRERVETFGTSEVQNYTVLIPYTIIRYFTGTDRVKQLYFFVGDPSEVAPGTEM